MGVERGGSVMRDCVELGNVDAPVMSEQTVITRDVKGIARPGGCWLLAQHRSRRRNIDPWRSPGHGRNVHR